MKGFIKRLLRESLEKTADTTFYDGGTSYNIDIKKDKFIHFSSEEIIDNIINEKKLKSDNSVFAVSSVWGKISKDVLPKGENLAAIHFTTDILPKKGYPEEVIWKGTVNLLEVKKLTYAEAIDILNNTNINSPIKDNDEIHYYGSSRNSVSNSKSQNNKNYDGSFNIPLDFIWEYREFDRCDDKEDNIKGNEYINRLMDDISKNGIKEPITLQMYNGFALVDEGNHRLCIARKLGLKTIPVKIIEKPFGGINKAKAKPIDYNQDSLESMVW